MCQGCDEDALAVADATGQPVEVVNAVRNAYRVLHELQDEELSKPEETASGPIGEDEELAHAFAQTLINSGAVQVVRPMLLGADPYVLVRILAGPEDGPTEVLSVESGGLNAEQRITVAEAALHTMRDPDSPCALPDGTLVGERLDWKES